MTTLITPLPTPPTRQDSSNFNDRADEFLGALPLFQQEANALAVDVQAAAGEVEIARQAVVSTANVTKWISGTTYSEGVSVWSPINGGVYRKMTSTTGGTTDPSLDSINYKSITDSNGVIYTPAGTGAVATTAEKELNRQTVSVFRFMTDEEIAAVQSYAFSLNVTAVVQNAINQAFAANQNLFVPAGGYLVTGIYLPGRISGGVDDRGRAFRLYGQGTGEAFVINTAKGTVFRSTTDAPVLQDYLDTDPSSNGSVEIDHIRFDGTSNTTPVVKLQSFFGMAHMHDCVVYQRGTGDGIFCSAGATGTIERTYCFNKDWATFSLGASRVGVGFNIATSYDQGLLKISKCTSRGWLTGYNIGGSAAGPISYMIGHCECSVVSNGVILASNTNKAVVANCYIEGGDGGVGVNNLGNYNTIRDNLLFPGFSIGIQDLSTTNKGSLIEGNIINIGNKTGAKCVAIQSSSAFGGWNKNVVNNSLVSTLATAGSVGIELSGETPRVNISGNSFDPKGSWSGVGAAKISDISTGGVFGVTTKQSGDWEFPCLSGGAISLFRSAPALTQANVSANNLTVPEGSYFVVTATVATSVQKLTAGETAGRIVIFRTTNASTTFADSAFIQLAGNVAFTGPGTITFFIDKVGADSYAYELCRSVL